MSADYPKFSLEAALVVPNALQRNGYFVGDLPALRTIVQDLFEVLNVEDKISESAENTFGYSSVHFICTLKATAAGPRYDDLKDIKFEVQTRTILMDAWANVSHYLAYKGEQSIPANLRRDFNALAGLFHIADQQFQSLSVSSRESEVAAEVKFAKTSDTESRAPAEPPIDRSTMTAYLRARYPDRVASTGSTISDFVEEITEAGYTSFVHLDNDLTKGHAEALASEKLHPPARGPGEGRTRPSLFQNVGLARTALEIVNPNFRVRPLGARLVRWDDEEGNEEVEID